MFQRNQKVEEAVFSKIFVPTELYSVTSQILVLTNIKTTNLKWRVAIERHDIWA
jgi:hypothetical protein